jgi:DNA-binding CsgD family transcriptional regulator
VLPFFAGQVLEGFDLAGVGLAILDVAGRLQAANGAAENILASRDGLEISPTNCLRVSRWKGSAARGFVDLQSKERKAEPEAGTVLAAPRPSGKRPLTVFIRFADGLANGTPTARAPLTFLFIVDPELPMRGMDRHLRQAYKLTAAELHLATLLMQGHNLQECCRRMRIQRSTAASHLQQLFNKTQARTQSQLVSVLFRRVGFLRSSIAAYRRDGAAGVGFRAGLG